MLESLWSDRGNGREREVGGIASVPGDNRPSEVAGETGAVAVEAGKEVEGEEAASEEAREGRPSEAVTGALR